MARFAIRPPAALVLIVCVAILSARRPDAFRNPQLWAEDGIFFAEAYERGGGAVLFQEFAGYLHLVPRLVAWVAIRVDPLWVPHVFVGSAAVLTLYVASRALSRRSPVRLRLASAVAIVLVPDAGEVLLNIVNIQWVLAGGLLLLALSSDPGNAWQKVHDMTAAAAVGLTGPFSIVLAPLFLWRAWLRRSKASWALASVVIACALVQAVVIHRNPQPALADGRIDVRALFAVPGLRVGGSLLLGKFLPQAMPWPMAAACSAMILMSTVTLAVCRGSKRFVRGCLAMAFVALLGSVIFRYRVLLPSLVHSGNGSRYFFPLQLAVIWLWLVVAAGRGKIARIAVGALMWSLAVNVPRLRETEYTDMHWADYAQKIRARNAVDITINPGFRFSLPERKP